jgi:hypothetical protein
LREKRREKNRKIIILKNEKKERKTKKLNSGRCGCLYSQASGGRSGGSQALFCLTPHNDQFYVESF